MAKNLVIDDNLFEHQIFQLLARKFFPNVKIAYSDEPQREMDHIIAHAQHPEALPDKIILDLYMPVYSGYDFLKDMEVLQYSLSKVIAVYIFSSSISPHDIQLFKNYSFIKAYIPKPLNEAKLRQIFEAV